MTEKLKELSNIITNYSIKVQKGERVLITSQTTNPIELINYLIDDISKRGGIASVNIVDQHIQSKLLENTSEERIKLIKKQNEFEVDNYDSFIHIKYRYNDYEGKNILPEIQKKVGEALTKSQDVKINKRKWVLLNFPSVLDAYKAHMTTTEFQKYALDVMTVDYQALNQLITPLKNLLDKTDQVHIVSPGTDITFSIKGMRSIPCTGEMNIPDGELFTAPVRTSVNGKITYNTPSPYNGNIYNNVSLEFKDGKIIKATCDEDDTQLNEIFNSDPGARYVGEFSLGFNPKILNPMGDILYDEKILGSLHFTPGRAYKECYNGNDSSIHWDMVLIQRAEYGGGEIYFDDVLIRKDGFFIPKELQALNFDYKNINK